MKRNFDKRLPTIYIKDGVQYLCDSKGEIKPIVSTEVIDNCNDGMVLAKVVLHVNLCGSHEEAQEKYKE